MTLAFCLGDIDESASRQTAGVGQYWTGDNDLVIPGKALGHSQGSVF